MKTSSLHTNYSLLTVLGAMYLVSVDSPGHGPSGDNVVHYSLTKPLRDLVELQEISHTVQHLMVAISVSVHLLEDSGHVPKDGGVQ